MDSFSTSYRFISYFMYSSRSIYLKDVGGVCKHKNIIVKSILLNYLYDNVFAIKAKDVMKADIF